MRARVVTVVLALVVGGAVGLAPTPRDAVAAHLGGSGELHPLPSARLLDTRSGAKPGPGATVTFQVTGRGGVPAENVLAVGLSLTAAEATSGTAVTAYPSGAPRPRTTALHVAAGEAATAAVVVPVGGDGRVTLYNASGSVHLEADVTGWYGTATAAPGLRFHPFAPQPAYDTRTGGLSPLAAGETRGVHLPHYAAAPFANSVVLLRVTVPNPSSDTRITVYPSGTRPAGASLVARAGRVSSTVVPVAMETTYGGIQVHNASGSAHVVLHVEGWADEAAAPDDGRYRPLPVSARLADTRNGTNVPVGPLGSGGVLALPVAGYAGVPHDATSALLTVSAVRPSAAGALTVHPEGSEVPAVQQVGYAAGRAASSLVVAKLGRGGRATVRASGGPVHVSVDVHGWYTGRGDYVPMPGRPTPGGMVADTASRYLYATNPVLNRIEVVELATGSLLAPIPLGGKEPLGIDLTPDGSTLYVTNAASHDISVVDVRTRTELRRIRVGNGEYPYRPTDIAIGAYGRAVVYVMHAWGEGAVLLRLADDLVYGQRPPWTSGQGSLAASADRRFVAIGYAGSTPADVSVYDAEADRFVRAAHFLSYGTRRAAASSDGALLVGLPYIVDRVNGEVRTLPPAQEVYSCTGAAFSPDDELLYSACGGRVTAVATSDLSARGSVRHTGYVDHDYWRSSGVAVGTRDGSRVAIAVAGGVALVPVGP